MDDILQKYGVTFTGRGPTDGGVELGGAAHINPEDSDPMQTLGFGFEAYWKMLSSMSIVFLVLTVLFIPQLSFYYEAKGLEGLRNYNNA